MTRKLFWPFGSNYSPASVLSNLGFAHLDTAISARSFLTSTKFFQLHRPEWGKWAKRSCQSLIYISDQERFELGLAESVRGQRSHRWWVFFVWSVLQWLYSAIYNYHESENGKLSHTNFLRCFSSLICKSIVVRRCWFLKTCYCLQASGSFLFLSSNHHHSWACWCKCKFCICMWPLSSLIRIGDLPELQVWLFIDVS